MAHYIDKDALVAEIKRLAEVGRTNVRVFDEYRKEKAVWLQQADVCDRIISFIDTLEVKEVDLESEMDKYFETMEVLEHENIFEDTFQRIAKHFFELEFKAKQD